MGEDRLPTNADNPAGSSRWNSNLPEKQDASDILLPFCVWLSPAHPVPLSPLAPLSTPGPGVLEAKNRKKNVADFECDVFHRREQKL